MLTIRDLAGNEEMLTDHKELARNRKVNGEKSLSLTILPTVHNQHSFKLVEEESTIDFDGEEYVVKKMVERNIGNTSLKRIDAIHKFYVDLINKQQPTIHNGSITFFNYMQRVFEGTGYTFSVIDTFYAQSFENLGNDNRLSLLQKGLERYKAEMEIVGNDVRFKKQVGNDTDFQFRYAHNIKTIERTVDTTNLATVIRGTGKDGITAYYRSPNVDAFGEIDAPPVEDERFTTVDSLLAEMKARLQDTPEFSITIDFVDLRAAGYPWTVPNEGDRVYVIYEPMNDLLIETRILEINEVYDVNGNVIKTDVTLANHKKTFAGTMFNNIQKRLREIVNEDGVVKYSVLDEAVRVATESLQSAQTELEFENGIIARSKVNPNHIVLFNSSGVGVSTDGGQTFKTAMTAEGIVADVITAGTLRGIAIESQIDDFNYTFINGGYLESRGQYERNWRGDVTEHDIILRFENGYLRARNDSENRSLYFTDFGISTQVDGINASGTLEFFSKINSELGRGVTLSSEGVTTIEANGGAIFLDSSTTVNASKPIYSPSLVTNTENAYIGMDGELRVVNKAAADTNLPSESTVYRDVRASVYRGIALDLDGTTDAEHLYVRPSATGVLRVTSRGTTDSFRPVEASEFNVTSSMYLKKNIEDYTEKALEKINATPVRLFHLEGDDEDVDPKRIGTIVQESPVEVVNINGGQSLNVDAKATLLWKGVQELSAENQVLKQENIELKQRLDSIEQRLAALEA
jgi:phage minor structural protein